MLDHVILLKMLPPEHVFKDAVKMHLSSVHIFIINETTIRKLKLK